MIVQHLMEQYDPKKRNSQVGRQHSSYPRDQMTTSKETTGRDSETLAVSNEQPNVGRMSTLIYKPTRRDSEFLNEYSKAASPRQAAMLRSRMSIGREERIAMDSSRLENRIDDSLSEDAALLKSEISQ